MEKRGFLCQELFGRVTLNDFRRKLNEIISQIEKTKSESGMFMLAISCHGTENDELLFSDDTKNRLSRLENTAFKTQAIIPFIKKSQNYYQYEMNFTIFRAEILDLIPPVLNCPKLEGVPKVFVLNYCRGLQNFKLAQKVSVDGNDNFNVTDQISGHFLDDCLFYYSTAPGNPAVRNTFGSLYFKAFFNIIIFSCFVKSVIL